MQKKQKAVEKYKEKRRKEQRRKLDTKEERAKEQREGVTRCESQTLRPVKRVTTKRSKQLGS